MSNHKNVSVLILNDECKWNLKETTLEVQVEKIVIVGF